MRIASIDIGTNTILLLVVDVDSAGNISPVRDEQVIARLGKGVDANKIINQETFERAGGYLAAYRSLCDTLSVETIYAVGTSALRDAKNTDDFCRYIRKQTGIDIAVLSGDEEAEWTYRGAISEFSNRSGAFTVLDIGGGSTEIITGTVNGILSKISIDIGSVRLTERILLQSPPEESAVVEAYGAIQAHIPDEFTASIRNTLTVGVAGTVTTLAALHQNLPSYSSEKVSGYSLSYDTVCSLFGLLKGKNLEQIKSFPQISAGRADILLAGIMILMGIMEKYKIPSITVSDRGLRYGIALRAITSLPH